MDFVNPKYLAALSEQSKKTLAKNYNLDQLRFTGFEFINAFLIDKALNTEGPGGFSLLIKNPEKELKRDYYVPAIISAAVTLFFRNYADDHTVYRVGDVLQDNNGVRYEIVEISDGRYHLDYESRGATCKRFINAKEIKEYIITTADLKNRRVKLKFNQYKQFFDGIFSIGDCLPSRFHYKSVIIVDKKDFFKAVKKSDIPDLDLHKSLPFEYVTKNGKSSPNLPIEPMIYFVPDYETYKEFIRPREERIDTIIFIGANKYNDDALRDVKRDIRSGSIKNALFIGKDDIENFEGLKQWKWTLPELSYFNESKSLPLEKIEVDVPQFLKSLADFESYIRSLERKYTLELNAIFKFRRHLFCLVLPDFNSRLRNQIEYVRHSVQNELDALFKEKFISINVDPSEKIKNSQALFGNILSMLPLSKFEVLRRQASVDILIVSKWVKDIWEQEIEKYKRFRSFQNTKIFTPNDFFEQEKRHTTVKNVYLLSLFGFKIYAYDLVKRLSQCRHKIHFLLYSPEVEVLEKLLSKFKTALAKEYESADRLALSGVPYPRPEATISDVIERFYQVEEKDRKHYEHEQTEPIAYQLEFEGGFEPLILDGNKSVLLETEQRKRKERVSNLLAGDQIRVYDSATREQLFEIASNEDKEGRFSEIDAHSKLWKRCLKNYFDARRMAGPLYQLTDLMDDLQKNGSTLKNVNTLKKWLNKNDKEKFPAAIGNLLALKKTIHSDVLDTSFEQIKRSRKSYRSIMIALGRDLSDELMDYIISKKKGKILRRFHESEIESFVTRSAPLRTIKQIQITEASEDD